MCLLLESDAIVMHTFLLVKQTKAYSLPEKSLSDLWCYLSSLKTEYMVLNTVNLISHRIWSVPGRTLVIFMLLFSHDCLSWLHLLSHVYIPLGRAHEWKSFENRTIMLWGCINLGSQYPLTKVVWSKQLWIMWCWFYSLVIVASMCLFERCHHQCVVVAGVEGYPVFLCILAYVLG